MAQKRLSSTVWCWLSPSYGIGANPRPRTPRIQDDDRLKSSNLRRILFLIVRWFSFAKRFASNQFDETDAELLALLYSLVRSHLVCAALCIGADGRSQPAGQPDTGCRLVPRK